MTSLRTLTILAVAATTATLSSSFQVAYNSNRPPSSIISPTRSALCSVVKAVVHHPHDDATILPTTTTPAARRRAGPLSMDIEELGKWLDGKGRAQAAWDCYRIGVEPLHFYDNPLASGTRRRHAYLSEQQLRHLPMGDNDHDSPASTQDEEEGDSAIAAAVEANIRSLMPSKRKTEGMGKHALNLLSLLYHHHHPNGGGIEDTIASISQVDTSSDGTTKLLVKLLQDGLEVETVVIPFYDRDSSTLCISSQVGCRQGCTFCATGRMGKLRSLSSDEILAQVFLANKVCRIVNHHHHHHTTNADDTTSLLLRLPSIDNIVFMGMGEPADNADNVVTTALALTDGQKFKLAPSKVTISTVGPTPDAFRDLAQAAPCTLAWSVHAANDVLRKRLVPTTRHTMRELRQGLIDSLLMKGSSGSAMLEVALMADVNDTEEAALELVDLCQGLKEAVPGVKLTVNLIPYNNIEGGGDDSSNNGSNNNDIAALNPNYVFRKPSRESVLRFQSILVGRGGILTFIRSTRGDDESAACGQLATKRQKKRKTTLPA